MNSLKKYEYQQAKAFFKIVSTRPYTLRRVGEGWKRHKLKVKHNKDVKVNMTF